MRRENTGRLVRVYRNLRTGGYSVLDAKTHRVIHRAQRVVLGEVEFVVRKAGRAKVLKEKRKNVHAFAVGLLMGLDPDPVGDRSAPGLSWAEANCEVPVRYNPYEYGGFLTPANRKIRYAEMVLLDGRGVHIDEGSFIGCNTTWVRVDPLTTG